MGLNQYAIVMCSYAVMAVSRNGFFLFEKVSVLPPRSLLVIRNWVVVYMHEKLETLVNKTSNVQDWAPTKFTCYTELGGGVHSRKTRNTSLYNKQRTGLVVFM
jgi:hypothetical protein